MKPKIQNKQSSPNSGSWFITARTKPGSNKTRLFQIVILLLLIPLIVGCGSKVMKEQSDNIIRTGGGMAMGAPAVDMGMVESSMDYDDEAYSKRAYAEPTIAPMPPIPGNDGEEEIIDVYDRKVIKTASLSVEVQDYETASIKVLNLAQKYSGFVADSNSYTDKNGKKRGHANIRVPSLHFDAALIETGQIGEVKSQTLSGNDVTENYMDTETRLKNSEQEEERLLEVLDEAKNVDEILRVERELSRVRYEIESAQGRLNYLDNHVSYSSIQVELYEPTPVVKESGLWRAVKDAVNLFLGTLRFMIRTLGLLLPFILLVAVIVGLIVLVRRKTGKKKK